MRAHGTERWAVVTPVSDGPARWGVLNEEYYAMRDPLRAPWPTTFSASLRMPRSAGQYEVRACATVDAAWASPATQRSPEMPAQTHLANARTNPEWRKANGPYEVVGRTHWCSGPQRIVVSLGSSLVDPIAAPLTIPPVLHNGRIPGSMAIVGAVGATCVLAAVLMARGMRRRGSARSANYKGTGENRGTAAGTDGDVELRMLLTGR